MMSKVLVFDFKGTISSNIDTLKRHQFYREKLIAKDRTNLMTILTRHKNSHINTNLQYVEFFKIINLIRKNNYYTRLVEAHSIIILGEPIFTPFAFRLFFFRMKRKPLVQIQIHGDFFSKAWASKWTNKWKYLLIKTNIKYADSLRFVSEEQYDNFRKRKITFDQKRIVIAPIPVFWNRENVPWYSSPRPHTIGFFGRLNSERGIERLLRIIERVTFESEFKFLIAGSGKEMKRMNRFVVDLGITNQVIFMGVISSEESEKFWANIGLLINTAELESYGMAMRESLARNIPVLSISNGGVKQLKTDFPEACVTIFDEENFAKVATSLRFLCEKNCEKGFFDFQKKRDIENLDKLIESWR